MGSLYSYYILNIFHLAFIHRQQMRSCCDSIVVLVIRILFRYPHFLDALISQTVFKD